MRRGSGFLVAAALLGQLIMIPMGRSADSAPDPMAAFRHTNVFAARRVFGFGPPRPPVCRLAATPVPSTSETEEKSNG